jgi:predicted metal-dependent phosphoesterase TrpH
MMLKADLHIHTEHSFDSTMSADTVVDRCLKKGITCVAIADHGTIAGALEMKAKAPFRVIVAEEILTPLGEIIGLFLTEEIPSPLSAEEAVKRIKDCNGLVCIPHPFDRLRGIKGANHRGNGRLADLAGQADIIEVFNSRALPLGNPNRKARAFAAERGLLCSAGSDAHVPSEVGRAYVELPEFATRDEFCAALRQGRIFGQRTCPVVHIPGQIRTLRKRLFR